MALSSTLFHVPPGAAAQVSIIDTTFRMSKQPTSYLLTPDVEGFDMMPTSPSWSYLIESSKGEKALFDLGGLQNIEDYAPSVVGHLHEEKWEITMEKNVAEILSENDVDPDSIQSIIWSHTHWDHIGDPSVFSNTTDLFFGPGVKNAYYPGYPARSDSPLRESDFSGRNTIEVDFSGQNLTISDLEAFDFFGDGSFYLLSTPGHAIGHLSGLVRTTTCPDTFIFMGGDISHHGGEFRPSSLASIPEQPNCVLPEGLYGHNTRCPSGDLYEELNVKRGRGVNQTFFDPLIGNTTLAIDTISRAQIADAQDNVFFLFAHNNALWDVVDFFPLKANQWKKKGWREKIQWQFLADLASGIIPYQHSCS